MTRLSDVRAAAILAGCAGAAALFLAGRTEVMPLCAALTCAVLLASEAFEETSAEDPLDGNRGGGRGA